MELYKDIKEEDIYTWPNPHFPFKCLLAHEQCRIFILENIPHNYKWLSQCKNSIRETDFFFVTLGWNLSKHLANQSRSILEQLKLNVDNFFILFNSPEEEENGALFGLKGDVINHNAWLDENKFILLDSEKKYDALYIARPTDFKRHYLASKIQNLALAAGGFNHRNLRTDLPRSQNDPFKFLSKEEVCKIINLAKCGLSLSREEGACYSSSEYLLCGVPVVSTQSQGGRDVWYTEHNSILCEDNDTAVEKAVREACDRDWDSELIRKNHLTLARFYRYRFLVALQEVLNRFTSPIVDAEEVFLNNFTWYCNEDSCATPHLEEVEAFFE